MAWGLVLPREVNNRSRVRVPAAVRRELVAAVRGFRRRLGGNLHGVYLHGSLAIDGFDSRRSDIDLLVLVRCALGSRTKRTLIEAMLQTSNRPRPIEMSIVARRDLVPWRHPAPFQLHWSEDHREAFVDALKDGSGRAWGRTPQRDGDLAAHLAMARTRGVTLYGPAPTVGLPFIPHADVADSLACDGAWASRLFRKDPGMARYAVANACRRLAFFRHGFLLSKVEGTTWALGELASRWHGVIRRSCRSLPHPRVRAFLSAVGRMERSARRADIM